MPGNRMPDRTVSPMSRADLDEVVELERRCFRDPWPRDLIAVEIDETDERRCSLVLREGGAVLGYMMAWFVADEAHLGNIAVAPEARGTGVASLLLEALIEGARLHGCVHTVLEVRAGNEQAIALYRRHGFDAVAVRKGYYQDDNEDAVIMMRVL